MLKHGTDVHASFEITSKSQGHHTSIQSKECRNKFGVIVHGLIIGGLFESAWPQNL